MVSKNNHQFYQQKHAERKQRWGIRKLSVGVASVLLGTTFMLYGNHAVLADTVTSPSDDVPRLKGAIRTRLLKVQQKVQHLRHRLVEIVPIKVRVRH
nr:YSIRK-type signal peptide-containing protein [Limosilactobacillus sp. DJ3M12]